ncbi:MAG: type IV pilus twitching motility protein PilT [Phycisphaerae bacterium]
MNAPAERQPIDKHDQFSAAHGQPARLEQFFAAVSKAEASDLHLKAGRPPHLRIDSRLRPTTADPLSSDEIEEMAMEIMTEEQRTFFKAHGSLDLAHEIDGGDRYRINVFRQRGQTSVAARRVTKDIPDFESLHLPPVMGQVANEHQGLILLAGPTGSGKSTTIASMLEYINSTRSCHIVTVEDPIEYLYEDKKALVNQREIGIDVEDFDDALKYLMREDPDVVLVGEMRDHETFQAALQASETGHLVFGTIHASGAATTIGRILDLFPPDARDRVRQSLAFNLKAVICQRLLPSIKEEISRVPTVEVMLMNPSVRQMIENERDAELNDIIRSNEQAGMQSFTTSLLKLIDDAMIDPKVAYEVAPNVDELKMRMKGINTSRGGLLGR